MRTSYEEMMLLYSQLSLNEKRNEFSSLLGKTNELISELLKLIGLLEFTSKVLPFSKSKFPLEDLWCSNLAILSNTWEVVGKFLSK